MNSIEQEYKEALELEAFLAKDKEEYKKLLCSVSDVLVAGLPNKVRVYFIEGIDRGYLSPDEVLDEYKDDLYFFENTTLDMEKQQRKLSISTDEEEIARLQASIERKKHIIETKKNSSYHKALKRFNDCVEFYDRLHEDDYLRIKEAKEAYQALSKKRR